MSEKQNLLPCDFCGGKSLKIESGYNLLAGYHAYLVACNTCGARGRSKNHNGDWCKSEKEAIEAWNDRVNFNFGIFPTLNKKELSRIKEYIDLELYVHYCGSKISPHIVEMVNSGALEFPDAPVWKEVEKLRSALAEFSTIDERANETIREIANLKPLVASLRAELAAMRKENAALKEKLGVN